MYFISKKLSSCTCSYIDYIDIKHRRGIIVEIFENSLNIYPLAIEHSGNKISFRQIRRLKLGFGLWLTLSITLQSSNHITWHKLPVRIKSQHSGTGNLIQWMQIKYHLLFPQVNNWRGYDNGISSVYANYCNMLHVRKPLIKHNWLAHLYSISTSKIHYPISKYKTGKDSDPRKLYNHDKE